MLRARLTPFARHALGKGYALARRLGMFDPGPKPIRYVAEKADWSIRHDAVSYAACIERAHPGTIEVTDRPERTTGRIAHFGSQFVWQAWAKALDSDTRCLVTFFHGQPQDGPDMARHVEFLLSNLHRLERVVTAASRVEARLLGWGVPVEKLTRVPLGVDLDVFRPPTGDERRLARQRFGVPEDRLCIGSFQKDGEGWGAGMIPKLIKGPDLFLNAVGRLAKDFPVFVLLTGPARGYVKSGLESLGIPYAHANMPNADLVSGAYHALDLYLVASREEGGPKSVLESLASGVPLVSTRVGMAEDVIRDGQCGFLADMPDGEELARLAGRLLAQPDLARTFAKQGLERIAAFTWNEAACQLYDQAYRPLLT